MVKFKVKTRYMVFGNKTIFIIRKLKLFATNFWFYN